MSSIPLKGSSKFEAAEIERQLQTCDASDLDLATIELSYESFRSLAVNKNLSPNERIGFPETYRSGFDDAILCDIISKLPALQTEGATIVDIGTGCAGLPKLLIEHCRRQRHKLILVDSEEMLSQLPDVPDITVKLVGAFPSNWKMVEDASNGADAVICYSVFHYIFAEGNPFEFLDHLIKLLRSNGRALIGDIPNYSKRRRLFSTASGREFHRSFTGLNSPPVVTYNEVITGKIDDSVLLGLMQRAQGAGVDAYLLPQANDLPMSNRRDDLLIIRT